MKILVTGAAGFIGSSLVKQLLINGNDVCGIDNHNDYYDVSLKEARLEQISNRNYQHFRLDISNSNDVNDVFEKFKPDHVINLAAQAGVRYSLENPSAYIDSNLVGFGNILECSRKFQIKHLVYASSSSVYGANTKMPFSTHDNVDHPISLYAATKKANELMAHTYSHLYNLPTTGLRFFTVYGPWDRPDMALQKFSHSKMKGETINVFNHGNHRRDFTFIDDIVGGIIEVNNFPAQPNSNWSGNVPDPASSSAPWRIYNIGNNSPVKLMDYINELEISLGREAKKNFLPIQPGDVPDTYADITDFSSQFDYTPKTSVKEGVKRFSDWFLNYYY